MQIPSSPSFDGVSVPLHPDRQASIQPSPPAHPQQGDLLPQVPARAQTGSGNRTHDQTQDSYQIDSPVHTLSQTDADLYCEKRKVDILILASDAWYSTNFLVPLLDQAGWHPLTTAPPVPETQIIPARGGSDEDGATTTIEDHVPRASQVSTSGYTNAIPYTTLPSNLKQEQESHSASKVAQCTDSAKRHVYALTSRRLNHPNAIPFAFDPADKPGRDDAKYARLPDTNTIIVGFPVRGEAAMKLLVGMYERTRAAVSSTSPTPQQSSGPPEPSLKQMVSVLPNSGISPGFASSGSASQRETKTRWILLGSTGIFTNPSWNAPGPLGHGYDLTNERGRAEDALLRMHGNAIEATVLDLAGLYGASEVAGSKKRDPADWIARVAGTKEALAAKGAVHLVHGRDVAHALFSAWKRWEAVKGKRWIVTDLSVYDWWSLAMQLGTVRERLWVIELMRKVGVRGLPREMDALGRKLDGREFWEAVESVPVVGRLTRV